ncbi:hypothetical protein ES319_A05G116800v1 [Gossypium barbadense]|uniref:Gamma-soluble NSF attachment protein n=2 Tax=Gossypium TaxID=3633 RepID=A0A5J5VM72_GOSBA|nr:hypothetical protein ES319_A05G116800v1 [Gossypium barbadense]TYH16461.1 hypothetical protein ES288_A05G118900v1 [Gossypium darwinii]
MSGSDPGKLIYKADNLTTLSLTRWSADWESATRLYEQAANGFRVSKDYENAKSAFEKASKGREMLSSPWDAAKSMESAAAIAKKASELYMQCDRPQYASDSLAKAARCRIQSFNCPFKVLGFEDVKHFLKFQIQRFQQRVELHLKIFLFFEVCKTWSLSLRCEEGMKMPICIQMNIRGGLSIFFCLRYGDACVLLEDDRKEQMALDLYHAVTNIYVKLEKYTDAVAFLLKLGLAADKCNATNSQCKAYLSAVIVYLYAHDLKQAEKCYNDCSQIDAFLRSDQNRFAGKLLSAYREGDVEEIKRVSQSRSITNLDSVIIKLARKLPTGDVAAFKTNAAIGEGEALDENDLT